MKFVVGRLTDVSSVYYALYPVYILLDTLTLDGESTKNLKLLQPRTASLRLSQRSLVKKIEGATKNAVIYH